MQGCNVCRCTPGLAAAQYFAKSVLSKSIFVIIVELPSAVLEGEAA